MNRATRWTLCAAWALSLACTGAARADDEAADAPAGLKAFVPFVGGEWTFDGAWSNGEALKAREKFDWGLNRKFITCSTWVTRNDGSGEYERYRAVYAARDGKPVLYNFAYDGEVNVNEVTVKGKVIEIRAKANSPQGEMVIRQEIELSGKDKFRWRVWLDRDGDSQQLMDGEWVRKAS